MRATACALLAASGCAHVPASPASDGAWSAQRGAAQPAIATLQAGDFNGARAAAERVIAADGRNPQARLVHAIALYQATMHQLFVDGAAFIEKLDREHRVDERFGREALERAERSLAAIDSDLAQAETEPRVFLELCLACWQHDWNENGRVDRRDERLFQIELDADGHELPEDDPRRKPTFRFDLGDVSWARAAIAFHRAALNLILAYRWDDFWQSFGGHGGEIRVRLLDKERVAVARHEILAGLGFADRARERYLAETDDDREWVPNPRQESHGLPLPVDQALYTTWEAIASDLRRLATGDEGLSIAQLANLGHHAWDDPPSGFLDFGRLFSEPHDIVFDPENVFRRLGHSQGRREIETLLADLLGAGYRPVMARSHLVDRLIRMRNEVERGDEAIERKLRYLLWLN